MKRYNVGFCFREIAERWFNNNETKMGTWDEFETQFMAVFGRPALRKLLAEQRLVDRAQQAGETFTGYSEDIVDLCRRVNAAMPESEKIRHIMKGIEEDAFHVLLSKTPKTLVKLSAYVKATTSCESSASTPTTSCNRRIHFSTVLRRPFSTRED